MRHPIASLFVVILLAAACGGSGEREIAETRDSIPGSVPFDARFLDAMIEHHLGAVAMAGEALDSAVHPEILTLAEQIRIGQSAEIDRMRGWRETWYPGLGETTGMGMTMGSMGIGGSAEVPWDQRFLEAMISHHEAALDMAGAALDSAEHEEVRTMAEAILTAQREEIVLMTDLLAAWSDPAGEI